MVRVLDELPTTTPQLSKTRERRLRITGLVQKQLELTVEDVKKLPSETVSFDFECVEGWVVRGTEWEGVKVSTLLHMAGPGPEARYAVFKSGNYTECVPLSDTGEMVVAYRYRGQDISHERGGPLRLVFPSQKCYQSVKWLEEVELTRDRVEGTAEKVALGRISQTYGWEARPTDLQQ
ncbi:MAG: molybdopterin-dependent oxidoreductase [Candidatus Caldarchaeum sp.]|nr:molybdopterin-dependent oxidoreductase [Candidatus Caldarchaeum sp.]MCS7138284.1 molybdopterin-dependent oxidoreductase [Candidatus Caldarchaeum sp.]MDW7978180.1 molybdopterin-dependent oxidoreductase [Candidatus Caldarchaeum sp.]MDW8359438.1 molybdopterin-dependent oxidoreductase [Candidatus Caldarchaeum sp.]